MALFRFIVLSLVMSLASSAYAEEKPGKTLSEKEKIEALITAVESMKDAVFIRNGGEYGPKEAAALMRHKWKKQDKEIKTARDFIRLAASKSVNSGKPYLVRFKGGKEVESATVLGEMLEKIEKPAKKT